MSRNALTQSIVCAFVVFTLGVRAGTPISTTTASVTGKIDDWIYRGPIDYSWDSETTGETLRIPGHYVIILREASAPKKILDEINSFSKRIKFLDPIIVEAATCKQRDKLVLFVFAEKNAVRLRNGDTLSVKDYQMTIDRAAFSSSYKELRMEQQKK